MLPEANGAKRHEGGFLNCPSRLGRGRGALSAMNCLRNHWFEDRSCSRKSSLQGAVRSTWAMRPSQPNLILLIGWLQPASPNPPAAGEVGPEWQRRRPADRSSNQKNSAHSTSNTICWLLEVGFSVVSFRLWFLARSPLPASSHRALRFAADPMDGLRFERPRNQGSWGVGWDRSGQSRER